MCLSLVPQKIMEKCLSIITIQLWGEEAMTLCSQSGTFACFTLQVNHLKLETISLAWQHTHEKHTHLSQSILSVTARHERERQPKGQFP